MVMRCALMYGFEIVQLTGGHLEVAELRILRFSMGVTTMEGVEGGREGGVERKFEVAADALCNVELNSCY